MKRIYTYIMIAAGILMASCQEYTIDSQPSLPPTVRIDALDEYTVAATSPSRIVFNISANTPWSIETDSQWCIPSPGMSASSSLVSEIVITPENNESYEPRTATLTVSSDECGIVKTIHILQIAKQDTPAVVSDDPDESEEQDGAADELDITFAEGASYSVDQVTGYTRVNFTMGEMFRTNYTMQKGRFVIEFDDMKMSSVCRLGFMFLGTATDANFKLHMDDANTYWFRCAGAFAWNNPIKKAYTFDEVNAIRKIEFEVSAAENGFIDISVYIDGTLYGTHAGRTDVFASGAETGCVFVLEAGSQPSEGDYCVIRNITYISE